jgi:2-keto-4-pentenoate hydratase
VSAGDLRTALAEDQGAFADALDEAQSSRLPMEPFAARVGVSLADAYAIQAEVSGRRTAAGARLVGWKLSGVSAAAQAQLGIDAPVVGRLTSDLMHLDGSIVSLSRMIAPRVEVEMAFFLGCDLSDPDLSAADLLGSIVAVAPALDIADARVANEGRTGPDLVADRAAAGMVVLGAPRPLDRVGDLATLGAILEVDGDVVGSGAGARLMNHPVNAVQAAVRGAAPFGVQFRRGEIVLSGTLIDPVPASEGAVVTATFAEIGSVSVRFARSANQSSGGVS